MYNYRRINSRIKRLQYLFYFAHSQILPNAVPSPVMLNKPVQNTDVCMVKAHLQLTYLAILTYRGIQREKKTRKSPL